MTCIVGIIEKGVVHIGCDSLASGTMFKRVRKDGKVFDKGEFIIGACGSYRLMNIIEHCFTPPYFKEDTMCISKYMSTDFVDGLKKTFKERGFLRSSESTIDKGGNILVGFRGRLFEVMVDFQVAEMEDEYAVIGSGYPFAMGSLNSTKNKSVRDRLILALESAEKYDLYTQRPFNFYEKKNKKS